MVIATHWKCVQLKGCAGSSPAPSASGQLAERMIALVSKARYLKGYAGSNPALPALEVKYE